MDRKNNIFCCTRMTQRPFLRHDSEHHWSTVWPAHRSKRWVPARGGNIHLEVSIAMEVSKNDWFIYFMENLTKKLGWKLWAPPISGNHHPRNKGEIRQRPASTLNLAHLSQFEVATSLFCLKWYPSKNNEFCKFRDLTVNSQLPISFQIRLNICVLNTH